MPRKISRVSIIKAVEDPELSDESDVITEQPKTTSDYSLCENNSTIQLKPSSLAQLPNNDNFIVIWLHLADTYSDRDLDQESSRLQCAAQATRIFTDADDCIDFLTNVTGQDAFMILSGSRIEPLVLIMDEISKLQGIYILDKLNIFNREDFQQCKKLKGIFNDMEYLSNALNQHIHRLTISSMPFSIVSTSTSPNLGQLDQSFMYTQLIKEIILETEYDSSAEDRFVEYYLDQYKDDAAQSRLLRDFKQSYKSDDAIQWYARETFLYSWLNKALRLQDTKTIIRMAFYLRDLHQQIAKRCEQTKRSEKLIVYRGQQMSHNDFEKLKKSANQVLSFNGFLSTSLSEDVAKVFASDTSGDTDSMNVLFRMEIDPLASYSPFVFINELDSYNQSEEEEVLFCMQTIFRIGEMKKMHEYLWEIDLTLINDTDPDFQKVADFLKERWEGVCGWYRLTLLMLFMGKLDEATEIFNILSETTRKNDSNMVILEQIALVSLTAQKSESKEFQLCALLQLEETLKDWDTVRSRDHPMFVLICTSISSIYSSNGNFDSALHYAKEALNNINSWTSPDEHLLILVYTMVGGFYVVKENNEEALTYLQKALEIKQDSSLSNEPLTSVTYNLLAKVHANMNNNTMAIYYLNKAQEIQEKLLPSDHIELGMTYCHLGELHESMNNNKAAISYYDKALEIAQTTFQSNHLTCATVYNRLARLYRSMNEHEKALSYSRKALSIYATCSTLDHSDSVEISNNMAATYQSIGDRKGALLYYRKTLELQARSLASNHPDLEMDLYNRIGKLHYSSGEYASALSFFEKRLEMCEQNYPSGHPKFGEAYNSFGMTYKSMGDYDAADEYLRKALEIQQKTLAFDDPNLVRTCRNIATLKKSTTDCSSLEKATETTNTDN